jgi:hypothetical protein
LVCGLDSIFGELQFFQRAFDWKLRASFHLAAVIFYATDHISRLIH